ADAGDAGRRRRRACLSALLNPDIPVPRALPTGEAVDGLTAAVSAALGDLRGELAAWPAAVVEVARRRQAVVHAGVVIAPDDGAVLSGELERMTHAAAVAVVDLGADLRADHRAEHGADDDRYGAVTVVADARADGAADHAAEHRAHRSGVAASL